MPWRSRSAAARRSGRQPRRRRSVTARSGLPPRTDISPTGSDPLTPVTRVSISTPMRWRTPDQRQPRRVQANAGHRQLRVGVKGGGDQPGRCGRWVAGDLQLERPSASPDRSRSSRGPRGGSATPMKASMRSVWSRVGPGVSIDGLAGRAQPGKGGGSEQLGAGDRQVMSDGRERRLSAARSAAHGRRWSSPRRRPPAAGWRRAPSAARAATSSPSSVARSGRPATTPREQAHRRARVAAVERSRRETGGRVIT